MLERDGNYPAAAVLAGELAAIRAAVGRHPADIRPTTVPRLSIPAPTQRSPEPAVPAHVRQVLGVAQHRLADALVGLTEQPLGFDVRRVGVARSALIDKRASTVPRHAPAVAEALGDQLTPLFAGYARTHAKPTGDSAADVAAFVTYLRATGHLRGNQRRPRLRVHPTGLTS